MKTACHDRARGLTLIEVLVVIAIFVLLFLMLLPMMYDDHRGGHRVHCVSNLKQAALAFHLWASDHANQFPWQTATTNGGTLELTAGGDAVPQFLALSKSGFKPKVFHCPSDRERTPAENFEGLSRNNISYFLNLGADMTNNPVDTILAGDRNLALNGTPVGPGLLKIEVGANLNWTADLHKGGGNLAMADGHVEWCKTNRLSEVVFRQDHTNGFVVP